MFYRVEQKCRSCQSAELQIILSFGQTPIADRLLTCDTLHEPELIAPLTVAFCPECSLVQIRETVNPEVLFFEEYPYFSSVSKSLLNHFGASARDLIETKKLNSSSLVIEAASNDESNLPLRMSTLPRSFSEAPRRLAFHRACGSTWFSTISSPGLSQQVAFISKVMVRPGVRLSISKIFPAPLSQH